MKTFLAQALIILVGAASLSGIHAAALAQEPPTIGGGTLSDPAVGPGPAFNIGGDGFVLVKNWDFGTRGTIRNMTEMSANFAYHDQFGTIGNGTNYGARMLAADKGSTLNGQGIEDPKRPVREFFADSLKTYLVPLADVASVSPSEHNVGSGSFMAKWKLPNGGTLLKQDLIFETRVRYVTPPYFWFAIWTAGNRWSHGAEADIVESFGYDNGNGNTNYDGRFWHADVAGGTNEVSYGSWENGMRKQGVLTADNPVFDPTRYHVWTWLYRTDDTYSIYVDGLEVQRGTIHWTLSGKAGGEPIDMSFLFDGGWGHTKIASVNKPLPAAELAGKFYEWDYSRIYLRPAAAAQ
jgi:hypothetical protein